MPMKMKKRRRSRRFRGSHTHGRGFKKKARGSGHRGGVGMAGTGKRGDQKKTMILKNTLPDYFGKRARKLRFGKPKPETFNLTNISMSSLVSKKVAKESAGKYDISILKHKVVGELTKNVKLIIHAHSASESAIASVKKQGGEIIVKEDK
ncbi:50S ribosomal protein L15 [Candidatus Pacearchaeota archaeon]|nr:50S ribosomal protein L15 [Candidatus Pacearchaeota archaeon]